MRTHARLPCTVEPEPRPSARPHSDRPEPLYHAPRGEKDGKARAPERRLLRGAHLRQHPEAMREPTASAWPSWALLALALGVAPLRAAAVEAPAAPGTPASTSTHPVVAPMPTLYDIVGELGQADRLQRETAATLRETAGWQALTSTLDGSPLA